MAFPSNTISVDWSLIEIWCCGKFYPSVDISAHTELCHAINNKASSDQIKYKSTGSRSFLQDVVENQSSKSVESSGISTQNSVQMGKIGIAESAQDGDIEMRTRKRRILSERKSKIKADVGLANTSSGGVSDLKNLFNDDNDVEGDKEITRKIYKTEEFRKNIKGVGERVSVEKGNMKNGTTIACKTRLAKNKNAAELHSRTSSKLRKKCIAERQYPCDKCDYVGNVKQALNRHVETAHQGVRYKCSQCDFTTGYKYNFNSHTKAKHLHMKFSCDKCDYTCTERRLLNNHKNAVHDKDKVYSCSECDYISGYKYNLTAHVKAKHQHVFFPCDLCDYTGTCKRNLNSHVKAHHQGRRFPCPHCNADFGFKYNLNAHIKKKCPKRKNLYIK